jgi:hypothetical protein
VDTRKVGIFSELIEPQLQSWVDSVVLCCKMGFYLRLEFDSVWVQIVAEKMIQTFLQEQDSFICSTSEEFLNNVQNLGKKSGVLLAMRSDTLNLSGYGIVSVQFPPLLKLLPSFSRIVTLVLKKHDLYKYCDFIDGPKMSLLKNILEKTDFDCLIDSIVGLIYSELMVFPNSQHLSGESFLKQKINSYSKKKFEQSAEKAKFPKELFPVLDWVLSTREDPVSFLKVLLTAYCFEKEQENVTRASKKLKISRSSLYAHIGTAGEMGLCVDFVNPQKLNKIV